MKLLNLALIYGFTTLVNLSCRGVEGEKSTVSSVSPSRQSIVVLAGGFSSCDSTRLKILNKLTRAALTNEMYYIFQKMQLPKLFLNKNGSAPMVLSTCYTGATELLAQYSQQIFGKYTWNNGSLDDDRPSVKKFALPQWELLNQINFLEPIREELSKRIADMENLGSEVDLYFIGHSYGGFSSMQLASKFPRNFRGLITIDPISMMNCQASHMAVKVHKTLTGKHPGCLTSPKDKFSLSAIKKIDNIIDQSNGEKFWLHYYQNSFPFLHSDTFHPLSKYSIDHLISEDEFENVILNGDQHSQSGRLKSLWDRIFVELRHRL